MYVYGTNVSLAERDSEQCSDSETGGERRETEKVRDKCIERNRVGGGRVTQRDRQREREREIEREIERERE